MAVSMDNRPSRLRSALAAILSVSILLPAGLLFARVWQDVNDDRDSTAREQLGVAYLTSLSPLVSSLSEAQSSALRGITTAPGSLTAAVSRVTATDQRLGETLGTRERWTGLRDKIGALPSVAGSPLEIFQAHVEVTELTLALYTTVRINSGLNRDPDNDVSNLQQALGVDLPATVVHVSRMGDLSLMVAGIAGTAEQRAQQQAVLVPQFGAEVQAVNAAVANLTDNLQAAVDDTESGTLSGSLVTTVDSFRRGVESFVRGASPGANAPPDSAAMATAQSQLQTSLGSLAGVLVREMTSLLTERRDRLDNRRLESLIAAGVAVLLALTAVGVMLTGRRRRTGPPAPAATGPHGAMPPGPDGPNRNGSFGPVPPYGTEPDPTRRERSGALR
ncbi:hypothetical protein [Jidongwangia harbinensis]|uniref:hypothetical protein n=1 Tax=Jidongwangia harbinensis TaxID=2878561 RepID=UPI001CD9E3A7|nr:hypothetical protein [Jidongwangia harbinensis]MCA2215767.1 hypothetical protein [Jidongwangia harbinensis]